MPCECFTYSRSFTEITSKRRRNDGKKCYWSTYKNNRSECRTLLSSKKLYRSRFFFSHKQAISYPSNVHKKGKIAIVDISHLDHFHHSWLLPPAWNGDCNEWKKNRAKISLLRHSYAIIMQFLVQWSLSYMVDTRLHFFLLFIYLYGHHLLLGKCQMSFRYFHMCSLITNSRLNYIIYIPLSFITHHKLGF